VQGIAYRYPLLLLSSFTDQQMQSVEDHQFRRSYEFGQFLSVGLHERRFVLRLPFGVIEGK
jgi:hypothetical protein